MNVYFKPVDGGDWQPLGKVTEDTVSIEVPHHSEPPMPQKLSLHFSTYGRLTQEQYNKLFRPYPRLPRKLKKEIKSFRQWLGQSYKKCSRLELIQTCCLLWDMAPGHDGVITPAWLTRAGWAIAKGGKA